MKCERIARNVEASRKRLAIERRFCRVAGRVEIGGEVHGGISVAPEIGLPRREVEGAEKAEEHLPRQKASAENVHELEPRSFGAGRERATPIGHRDIARRQMERVERKVGRNEPANTGRFRGAKEPQLPLDDDLRPTLDRRDDGIDVAARQLERRIVVGGQIAQNEFGPGKFGRHFFAGGRANQTTELGVRLGSHGASNHRAQISTCTDQEHVLRSCHRIISSFIIDVRRGKRAAPAEFAEYRGIRQWAIRWTLRSV